MENQSEYNQKSTIKLENKHNDFRDNDIPKITAAI